MTPLAVAGLFIYHAFSTTEPLSEVMTNLGYATLVGAFGSMVVWLFLLPLKTWRIDQDAIIISWLGLVNTTVNFAEIKSFGIIINVGSHEHNIPPHSILSIERRDGRVFEFSSQIFLNNHKLEQFLQSRGTTRNDQLTSSREMWVWLTHMIIMFASVLVVLISR